MKATVTIHFENKTYMVFNAEFLSNTIQRQSGDTASSIDIHADTVSDLEIQSGLTPESLIEMLKSRMVS